MEDKKIIHGVDVTYCLNYQPDFKEDYDVKIKHFCCENHNSCESINNQNCYFKQLARKTAECEKLEVRLKNSENARNYAEKVCIDIELKKKIYEQALNDINDLVSKWYENEVIQYQGDYDEFLAIISKAKDEKNER